MCTSHFASILVGLSLVFFMAATPVSAGALRSNAAFNTGIGEKTAKQPSDGVTVAYKITLKGGELDGCTVDIVESLYGRDKGGWGIFDIAGNVTCSGGGFAYTTSGAWDGKGFHASGEINEGSGSGTFDGIAGRIAQLGGSAASAAGKTFDISYELVVDKTNK